MAAGTVQRHAEMLPAVRDLLRRINTPWVIENATLDRDGGRLFCGASHGLEIIKHMWFTSNVAFLSPPCSHVYGGVADGRYVAFARGSSAARLRKGWRLAPRRTMREYKAAAQIEWMSYAEAALASPPAYTKFIGEILMRHLRAA